MQTICFHLFLKLICVWIEHLKSPKMVIVWLVQQLTEGREEDGMLQQ